VEEEPPPLDRTVNSQFLTEGIPLFLGPKQIKADYAKYYKHALLYLACVNIDDLSPAEKASRANDLALSALLGDSIYNFGELVRDAFTFSLPSWDAGSDLLTVTLLLPSLGIRPCIADAPYSGVFGWNRA